MISEAEMDAHVEKHTGLLPYQQRVVDEKAQLDERLERLVAFSKTVAWDEMAAEDRSLLIEQRSLMHALSGVLARRIARFMQEKTK